MAGKGERTAAKQALKLALATARDCGSGELVGLAYRAVGSISALDGEDFVAERYLRESVDALERERRPLWLGLALADHARVLEKSDLGNPAPSRDRGAAILSGLGVVQDCNY
jgi:hypothetical protein